VGESTVEATSAYIEAEEEGGGPFALPAINAPETMTNEIEIAQAKIPHPMPWSGHAPRPRPAH